MAVGRRINEVNVMFQEGHFQRRGLTCVMSHVKVETFMDLAIGVQASNVGRNRVLAFIATLVLARGFFYELIPTVATNGGIQVAKARRD